jgi:hypothetical protein
MQNNDPATSRTDAPNLTCGQRDLLHVFRAVVNGRTPDIPPTDWATVWHLACIHELDAYLFPAVRNWPDACRPPQPLLDEWRRTFLSRTAAAVRTSRQIGELLAALHAADVPTMPLKGAWLAEHVYDDIAYRPMHDIDLLIRPDRLPAARCAMAAAGYLACEPAEPSPWSKDQHFRHPTFALGVELQWHLWTTGHQELAEPALDRVWSQPLPVQVAGQPALALPPARHLIYLTYHLLAHHWRVPLRTHLDLVLLGRRYGNSLSIDDLTTEAHAWQLGFRAPFVWRVAHDLCDAPMPAALTGWTPPDADGLKNKRSAAMTAALPESPPRVDMSVSLSDFQQAPAWRRPSLALRLVFLPVGALRVAHPLAMRRFGWIGGYTARLVDLLYRRMRDLLPGATHRAEVVKAAHDMSARLDLDRWLRAQE